MIDISLNDVQKYYGANLILENIGFELHSNDRMGIVGKNGCGKTTVFKMLTGEENYDKGSISFRKGIKLGYLPQDSSIYDEIVVSELLNDGFEELNTIKERIDSVIWDLENNIELYGELEDRYAKLGGYEREESLKRVTLGLKIDKTLFGKSFKELSGGERSRVLLGKTLLQNPEVLLLDEPTNHLDIDTVEWLEEFLSDYDGSVLIISHDRYFLDRVTNKILEISYGTSELYLSNFSGYLIEKKEKFERQLESYLLQQKKIKKMEDAIRRFRHWGANSDNEAMFKKAKNMEKRIERMDKIDIPKESKKINLSFNDDNESSKRVLRVQDLSKSFSDKKLFDHISFEITKGEKVALIGKNGTGKTTLIKIIMDNGSDEIRLAENIKIGYLDQNCEFQEKDMSILDFVQRETDIELDKIRGVLARYHFYGEDVFKKISSLSGGEKSRLKLFIMITKGFNFLVLDEPTNHLDIEFKEVFEETLKEFGGTVLFISHDRYFLNSVGDRIIELDNGKLFEYQGNYDYYKEKKVKSSVLESFEKKEYKKENKKFSNNYIQNLEKELGLVEEKLLILKNKLSEENDYIRLTELTKEISDFENKHNELLEKWMETN